MATVGEVEGGGARRPGHWLGVMTALVIAMAWPGSPTVAQFIGQGPGARPTTKVYFDSNNKADHQLRSADNHAKAGNYAEAVEIYQKLIQQFGDKVVDVPPDANGGPLAEDSRLSVNARRQCQARIAALPAAARELYRTRVDAQAGRWFHQGLETRDRSMLRRVVDQAYCSSWGDDALDLLGDLAFQDGQLAEALAAYSQLAPDRPDGSQGLAHPDPSVDLARVAAKKLLCRALIGEHPPTPAELDSFALAHPNDEGQFAGRRGSLARVLLDAIRDDHLSPSVQSDIRWPTFAGSPTRNRVTPNSMDVGSLQWRVELEKLSLTRAGGGGFSLRQRGLVPIDNASVPGDRLLAYHPIVVDDQVIICDDKHIVAYNLNSGNGDQPSTMATHVDVAWKTPDLAGSMIVARPGGGGLARYTMSAFGTKVYARMGPAPPSMIAINRVNQAPGQTSSSQIVAIDSSDPTRWLWKREALEIPLPKRGGEGGSRNAVFEGSPVADAHNVYVAMTDRIEMTATYVACFDAETGATRWVRYICEANANVDQFMSGGLEISHRLLTLDGPSIYYQTNLGAVASLEAESGSIRWLATYPWSGRNGNGGGHERDLNPAIVHDGLVIVAPDDTPAIYAFDAGTGKLAWKTDPIPDEVKLTHLLGVAKGNLIATGDKVLWFNAKTGKKVHEWPDNAPSTQGYGRGVLAGDRIYWPTKTEIHVLDQASGLKADAPIKLQETYQCEGGNLAIGDGYLIVAQANSLVVFCQNSRMISRFRDRIAQAPENATNYYKLAGFAEASGQDDLALESLEKALARYRPSDSVEGTPLAEVARDHQRRLLMKLGQKARVARDWPEAARKFTLAATAARSDRDKLAARLELAEVQLAQGDPKASVATLQALLGDERLRALSVDAADGHRSVRADLLIADRLASLIKDKGRDLYLEFDRAAGALLARGKVEQDPRLLEDVGRSYPVARVVPDAWLALGQLHDTTGHPGDAARAYKRVLAGVADDPQRARALWGLARAYEAQKLWSPARDAYLLALNRFADQHLDDLGPGPLRDRLVERLGREPFARMVSDRVEPNVPIPLRRRWDRRWFEAARPLSADGVPPSAEASRVFLVKGREIRPVDPTTGNSAWSRDLEGEPVWVGYLADRIIAATRTRLVALSLDKGAIEWQYDLAAGPLGKLGSNPFAGVAPNPDGDGNRDPAGLTLQDFRIVGNRIFCLRGESALLAFDGDSGLLDWSYSPSNGRINPHLLVGPRRIILQVRKPNAVLVLDTASGRRRSEFPQVDEEEWPRDPLAIDEDHVALVLDKFTVALYDLTRGVNAWVFCETRDQPKYAPPRLIGDAERLLVLHDGRELIRLDPATGAKGWSRLLGTESLGERPEAIALGDDRVFVANSSTLSIHAPLPTLSAYAIADGSTLWKRTLNGPLAGWAVALTERSVAAYPNPSRLKPDEELQGVPLFLCRRDDGEILQRLQFQSPITELVIKFSTRGALVATQGGLWALGDRKVMDVGQGAR